MRKQKPRFLRSTEGEKNRIELKIALNRKLRKSKPQKSRNVCTMISETPHMTIIPTTKIFAIQFSKANNRNMELGAYYPNIYFVPPDIKCTVRLA